MCLLQHLLWVKGKIKTNELPIRGGLSEGGGRGGIYFCLSSFFRLFINPASVSAFFLFFFSVSLPQLALVLPLSTFLLAQQAQTHSLCITNTKWVDSVMGTEGCSWSKVAYICVLIWITTPYRKGGLLCIFDFVFVLFSLSCIQCKDLRKLFLSLWFKWSYITDVKLLQERKLFLWKCLSFVDLALLRMNVFCHAYTGFVCFWEVVKCFHRSFFFFSPLKTGALLIQISKLIAVWESFASPHRLPYFWVPQVKTSAWHCSRLKAR